MEKDLALHSKAKATSIFRSGRRPKVQIRGLFQSEAGISVEPSTLRKLAVKLSNAKEAKPERAQTYSDAGK